jgi:uncharacterized protein with von Willebrand factor type A (vWA) domain
VPQFLDSLLTFGRVLRGAGIDVHPGRILDVVDALGQINLASRDEVYYTCRALLVHGPEQMPAFDRAFDAFWRGRAPGADAGNRREPPEAAVTAIETLIGDAMPADPSFVDADATSADIALRTWSDRGGLADKDFAVCTADERSRIARELAGCDGRRASAAPSLDGAAADRASICRRAVPQAGGRAATSPRCRAAGGGRGPARSSCSATTADP